ncbi:hypothetical protein L7F22_008576 [Adiantum nelumboides]|nr:hypothetical protein [Adiantum nelumboides]
MAQAQRSRRAPHARRLISTTFLFNPFVLCGSALFLLFLLSFIAGPLLVSPDQQHPGPIHQVKNSSLKDIWASKLSHNYYGCSDPSPLFLGQVKYQSNGYLLVEASGGLNQQRTGIIDAVVVAWILNATLVIPRLDHTSFWKDTSNFSDIFEEDQFRSTVGQFVEVVRRLPRNMQIHDEDKALSVPVPRKCTPDYYKKNVLPLLQKNKVILLKKFDYRLSNRLDKDLQKLRCKVNYHALQFTRGIKTMGAKLVERLRKRNGRYIALHLRFEPDMLAFTGCYYRGGEKEIKELMLLRKRWKSIPHRNPEKAWRNGRCPLTPEEVGLMLRALGYGSDTYLYVASGEIYGGERTLAPLRKMFPNFFTKDMLATHNDLDSFSAYSSRMAAIDYIVCDESDVFVTNNNGNMARMLAGRRRYFGHKRTIRPNAKKLKSIFLARRNMTWEAFRVKVKKYQKGFLGEPMDMRPGRGQFFENPSACICEKASENQNQNNDLTRDMETWTESHGQMHEELYMKSTDPTNFDQESGKHGDNKTFDDEYTDVDNYLGLSE